MPVAEQGAGRTNPAKKLKNAWTTAMPLQFPITTRRFWKLGGFGALALSFVFSAWILSQAVFALEQLLEALSALTGGGNPLMG